MSAKSIILGVVVFLVFAIVQMPASHVLRFVDLPPNIKLGAIQGTVWNGNTAFVETPDVLLESVQWQLSPWRLLLLQLSADVKVGGTDPSSTIKGAGQVTLSLGDVAIDDLKLSFPATKAIEHVSLPIPIDADGRLHLDIEEFSQGEPLCDDLGGNVTWRQASVITPVSEIPLSRLVGDLSCREGNIALVLKENPVGITLDVEVAADAKMTVSGYLAPQTNTPQELIDAVKMLGQADNQGRFRFDYKS